MSLMLLCFGFLTALVGICLAAIVLMKALIRAFIENRHRDAEAIINQGRVPNRWKPRLAVCFIRGESGLSRCISQLAKRSCLRRLDGLIRYFETCPYVADEETRQAVLQELHDVRESWQKAGWSELRERYMA